MRAAYLLDNTIQVGEVADPTPGPGQVLVRTRRCAVCASDQHFMTSGIKMIEMSQKFGGAYASIDLSRPIVMGHEFVGEILDYGPDSRRPVAVGRRVTSIPGVLTAGGPQIVGYAADYPGGFGELMVLDENLILEVPDEVSDEHAALIEPLAVGLEHARAGEPTNEDVPLVIGCGAIGLGVIAGLRLAGTGPIVAVDLDPGRRDLAIQMGADLAFDPRETSPYGALKDLNGRQVNLAYECVGKKGMLNQMVVGLGRGARIVMGGYSLEPEEVLVPPAQDRKLKIYFASGEEPQDMELALKSIADGSIDVAPLLGETVGLSSLTTVLDTMADPSSPIRTVIDPHRL